MVTLAMGVFAAEAITDEGWSLKSPVHAAVFLFFGVLYVFDAHTIGIAFIASSGLLVGRFQSSPNVRVPLVSGTLFVLYDLHEGLRFGAFLSLLAASSASLNYGGDCSRLLVFSAHRAFMCSLAIKQSSGMALTFVWAQILLMICYAEADCADAAIFSGIAASSVTYELLSTWRRHVECVELAESDGFSKGDDAHGYDERRLPVLKLKRGSLTCAAALLQAVAFQVDIGQRDAPDDLASYLTQSVHVAAILSSIIVIGPLVREQRFVKGLFVTASVFDAYKSFLRAQIGRTSSSVVAIVCRGTFDLLTAITYSCTDVAAESEQMIAIRSDKRRTSRTCAWLMCVAYACVHIVPVIWWDLDLDESISFAFHFPLLIASFAGWSLIWQDELAFYLTGTFCGVEAMAILLTLVHPIAWKWLALLTTTMLPLTLMRVPTKRIDSFLFSISDAKAVQ